MGKVKLKTLNELREIERKLIHGVDQKFVQEFISYVGELSRKIDTLERILHNVKTAANEPC